MQHTRKATDLRMDISSRQVDFTNAQGEVLSGQLDLPLSPQPEAFVIFSHCFTCNKHYKAPVYIARNLARMGIATLRFDFTGLGASKGDFGRTTLSSNRDDIINAARFLSENYESPRALIGHSFGGAAALLATSDIPSAELVVTIGTPSRPGRLGKRLQAAREMAERLGSGTIEVNGRTFVLYKQFFGDLEGYEMKNVVANLNRKLLIVHAPEDEIVPFSNAEELLEWAGLPKTLMRLEGGNHLVSKPEDAERVAAAISVRLAR